MASYARCINCGTDDVEFMGTSQYELDEYYCHDCERYFEIDWDEQDEIDAQDHEEEYEDTDEDENEDEEEEQY